jgi:two-component system KDP operon response regulator KdpE
MPRAAENWDRILVNIVEMINQTLLCGHGFAMAFPFGLVLAHASTCAQERQGCGHVLNVGQRQSLEEPAHGPPTKAAVPRGTAIVPSVAVQRMEDGSLKTLPVGARVLLVNNQEPINRALSAALPMAGYAVYEARKEALRSALSIRPDLIVLHLGLSEKNGKEVIRNLRERPIAPIIVISARHDESEKVSSLDNGAHDYLTEPFSIPELLARMRAALRSVNATQGDVFAVDDLRVDLGRRDVSVGDTPVKLTATEYELLKVLVHHAGKVRAHHQLIHELWGRTRYQDAVHLLRVTLSHLRRKLHPDPMRSRYIVTEPGVGYRLRTKSAA